MGGQSDTLINGDDLCSDPASAGQVWGPRPMPALSGLLFVWDDVVWAWADERICGYF